MKLSIRKIGFVLCGMILSFTALAQDIHVSNIFYNSPMINPAEAGLIDADFRVSTIFRDQWRAGGAPFQTYGADLDMRLLNERSKSNIGFGALAYRDVAGDLKVGNTHFIASLSGIVKTGESGRLSLGIQGGLVQNGIDAANMRWDAQYVNGEFNSSNFSGEANSFPSYMHFDLSTGIAFEFAEANNLKTSTFNEQKNFKIGVAVHHLNQPMKSYTNDPNEKLPMKYIGYANTNIGIPDTDYFIRAGLSYRQQGPYREANVGAMGKYIIQPPSRYTGYYSMVAVSVSVGGYYRVGDAFIPAVEFEYYRWKVGMSFDLTHNSFRKANNTFGGIEFYLSFINF